MTIPPPAFKERPLHPLAKTLVQEIGRHPDHLLPAARLEHWRKGLSTHKSRTTVAPQLVALAVQLVQAGDREHALQMCVLAYACFQDAHLLEKSMAAAGIPGKQARDLVNQTHVATKTLQEGIKAPQSASRLGFSLRKK